MLSGQGPFTVFAPSNLAFSKLGLGVFEIWKDLRIQLKWETY